jgi:hypothetical protein
MVIKITIKGLNERIAGINAVSTLKKNVHVWEKKKKGTHMRDSITVDSATPQEAIVGIHKPYAIYENRRAGSKMGFGTHNFIDQSTPTIVQELGRQIALEYQRLFSNL